MQIKNRQKVLAIAAIAGLVLLAADSLIFTPLTNTWQDRAKHIADLKKDISTGQQLLAGRSSFEGKWENMRKNTLQGAQSQAENEMLKAFDRWSQESRISISSIKPQWKQTEDDYSTLICRADATGNLDTITRFLYEVEKDPLAIKVDVVELTSHDNDGQQLSLGLQVSGLLLTSEKQ